jgi:hypothetical protein
MAGSVVSAKELRNVCPSVALVTVMQIVTIARMKEASVVSFQASWIHFLEINTILRFRFDYKLLKQYTLPKRMP